MASNDFAIQYSLLKTIIGERPGVADGMRMVFDTLDERRPHGAWDRLRALDWTADVAAFEGWLAALLRQQPLNPDTRALWFDVPDILDNDPYTTVVGFDQPVPPVFDPDHEPECTWQVEPSRRKSAAGEFLPLTALQSARALLRFGDAAVGPGERDRLRPGVYAIQFAHIALLVVSGLPRVPRELLFRHHAQLGITMGYHDGDLDGVGALSAGGWSKMRPPTTAERRARAPRPEELDPQSFSFNLGKYLATGRDINARLKDGRTVLMYHNLSDPPLVRDIIKAGADVNAADDKGFTVLWYFASGPLETLKVVLGAGANAKALNGGKRSVLEAALGSGHCTAEHIRLLVDAGANIRFKKTNGRTAMHSLAWRNLYDRESRRHIREMLHLLVSRGIKLDTPDKHGVTPLWVPIIEHCKEIDRLKGWLRGTFKPDAGTRYFYDYHRNAILLIEAGADPNCRIKTSPHPLIPAGGTPLMCGRYDRPELHLALLKHGADPQARSKEGLTALEYAERVAADRKRPDREGAAKVARAIELSLQRATKSRGSRAQTQARRGRLRPTGTR